MKNDPTVEKKLGLIDKVTNMVLMIFSSLCQNIFIDSKLCNNIEWRIQKTISNFR